MSAKGVSAVIATILMLMITIALAGTAYLYITGIFTAKTSVVLSIDGTASTCNGNPINVVVKNDGTGVASLSSMTITKPDGSILACNPALGLPVSINAGSFNNVTCYRPAGSLSGLYSITVSTGSSSSTGSLYCASAAS